MIAEKIHNDNISQLNVRIAHLSQHYDLFHIYSCFKIHELGKAQQPTNDFLGAILKELGIE